MAQEIDTRPTLGEAVSGWVNKYGGLTHVVGVVGVAAVFAYGYIPAVHTFCVDLWALLPKIVKEGLLAIGGLYTWYRSGFKGLTMTTTIQPGESSASAAVASVEPK